MVIIADMSSEIFTFQRHQKGRLELRQLVFVHTGHALKFFHMYVYRAACVCDAIDIINLHTRLYIVTRYLTWEYLLRILGMSRS